MPRIDTDIKLDFKDVLIRPKRSTLRTRADVNLQREFIFRNSQHKYNGVPIMAANMDTVGTFEMAKALAQSVAVSTGIQENDWNNLKQIIDNIPNIKYICMDVANGYSESFVNFVRKTREAYPKHTLLAGNVVTGEMVEELILSGADIIKVGIGPGSVCTTRTKTGVGYPQLSAIIECADAAHGLGGHIIADGGCTCPGDVVKAFGAGADFVMLGGMLAGHDQSGGEMCERNGKKYKQFYGMSSSLAQKKFSGKLSEYRASEGKTVEIPYKGDVTHTVLDILGGMRSACTYIGAGKLKELSRRTTFIRVSQQVNSIFSQSEVTTPHFYETK